MGCDIHLFIEYKANGTWRPFGSQFWMGRDYDLFARLAGVRNYDEIELKYPPRGMPEDAAFASEDANQFWISDNPNGCEGSVTKSVAAKWVEEGSAKYTNGDKTFITNPDAHTHSWLTREEFADCISSTSQGVDREYHAVAAAMAIFEEARVVFWFDN